MSLLLRHLGDGDDGSDSDEPRPDQATKRRTKTIDMQDKRGLTPLHWAAADGQEGAMRLLLEAGATVDVFDKQGMTPLALAVENEFLGAVKLLLKYEADENAAAAAVCDDDDSDGDEETGS